MTMLSYDFGSSPTPTLVNKSSLFLSLPVCLWSILYLTDRKEGRNGWGKFISYDGEKAWSSIDHSLISASTTYKPQNFYLKAAGTPEAFKLLGQARNSILKALQ
jgi:hypothetical protein